MKLVRRLLEQERIRFLVVGGVNTAFGYAAFTALFLLAGRTIGYLGSLYLSYLAAIALAFALHRRFTFRASGTGGRVIVDVLRFCSVYVVALIINSIGLPLLVEVGDLPALAAQAIMLIVTTVISYFGHKYFSFRRSTAAARP